jgi:hypothetical protein
MVNAKGGNFDSANTYTVDLPKDFPAAKILVVHIRHDDPMDAQRPAAFPRAGSQSFPSRCPMPMARQPSTSHQSSRAV